MAEIKQLCDECKKERKRFLEQSIKHSPGCTALWRLAFNTDETAWVCVVEIFKPIVERAIRTLPRNYDLSLNDPSTLAQDVFANLLSYSRNYNVEALELVSTEDLSRLVAYIKIIALNLVRGLWRKPQVVMVPLVDELNSSPTNDEVGQFQAGSIAKVPPFEEELIDRITIQQIIERYIENDQDRIILELGLLNGLKAKEIYEIAKDKFSDIKEVYQTSQRVIRRLKGDPQLRSLYSSRRKSANSASLHFRFDHNEVRMDLWEPCPYDEGILVDYVNGHASADVITAIERSPACLAAVAALRADLAAWRPSLRQMFCPASEQLVAYQERRLAGTDYLVIHKHVQQCPYCRAEIQMLAAVDAPEASLVRRIIDFVFQPATMAPIPARGAGSYRTIERTPQIELFVGSSPTTGKQRNWILSGRLRSEGDQPVLQVASIVVEDIEEEEAFEFSTTVDEHGAFTVKGLDAGVYRIRILTANEEIVLREFKVGDDL